MNIYIWLQDDDDTEEAFHSYVADTVPRQSEIISIIQQGRAARHFEVQEIAYNIVDDQLDSVRLEVIEHMNQPPVIG